GHPAAWSWGCTSRTHAASSHGPNAPPLELVDVDIGSRDCGGTIHGRLSVPRALGDAGVQHGAMEERPGRVATAFAYPLGKPPFPVRACFTETRAPTPGWEDRELRVSGVRNPRLEPSRSTSANNRLHKCADFPST